MCSSRRRKHPIAPLGHSTWRVSQNDVNGSEGCSEISQIQFFFLSIVVRANSVDTGQSYSPNRPADSYAILTTTPTQTLTANPAWLSSRNYAG